jgi:hypothetical protein
MIYFDHYIKSTTHPLEVSILLAVRKVTGMTARSIDGHGATLTIIAHVEVLRTDVTGSVFSYIFQEVSR